MSKSISLSILIPVYNCDVRSFVTDLNYQAAESGIEFEILCFDDFSQNSIKEINKNLLNLPNVNYKELDRNYGRSVIRNILARAAKYDFLLFLDCDGKLVSDSFIKDYIDAPDSPVKIGGRVYSTSPPENQNYYLHWIVGSKKEVFPASVRQKNSYSSIMLNNFFIQKEVYLAINLEEQLQGYGHEDSLFGYELEKYKIPVLHLDNPVLHQQLDEKESFLKKSEEAIANFVWMLKNKGVGTNTRLFTTYHLIKKLCLLPFFRLFIALFKSHAFKILLGKSPKLIWYDLLKLHWLDKEMKKY